jgi:lipopolysaccharide biosynthesis regulator YciM
MSVQFDDAINELCRDIAEATLTDFTEDEYENMMDEMFAEHQALMYAAQSYDNDAVAYGLG